ncbi:ATP-dependent RNA helicase MSS116 [Patellaria atrata CBS 101060]|uniref:ATP-dependent RNA helicase n=1 Tax=Patellaria atrata CBS 101060 TaxID=1346257 RepID=A0A9P4S2G9_9PEZI|nr:ATP-dependent RNA helicase MSS116 [Patellaria atrata CBS 101060]
MSEAAYSTSSLRERNAQPYKSMAGKLHPELLASLDAMSFEYMTPVQEKVLTGMSDFRADLLVQAKTGTGKTVAFLLPALQTLLISPYFPPGQVAILVISPTRELALQIAKECNQLTSKLSKRIECHTAFGGTARAANMNKFLKGFPTVLVVTPGRLKDYLTDPKAASKLWDIRTLILDEADTMLERGFLQDVKEILKALPPKREHHWQGMCFSATIPQKIRDVLNTVLDPNYVKISTFDEQDTPTIDTIAQYCVVMPSVEDTFTTLKSLIDSENDKGAAKIIVFGVTANMVALFANFFSSGLTTLKVSELHSRLNQNARTRTTDEFKAATSGIMFASDVIGRGMDFPNVDLVIQVGLPTSGEQYIHRVGRTGRAGNEGRAVLLLTERESFFPRVNKQLPIQQHPNQADIVNNRVNYASLIETAMNQVDEKVKQRAYSAYIGFFAGSGILKQVRLDKEGLVAMANELAIKGMHCPEPPPMEKRIVGKMGLKGVKGFNYATADEQPFRTRKQIQQQSNQPPRTREQNQQQSNQLLRTFTEAASRTASAGVKKPAATKTSGTKRGRRRQDRDEELFRRADQGAPPG